MSIIGWAQIALTFGLVLAAALPLGFYIAKVFSGGSTVVSPVLAPVERGFYRAAGIDPAQEQSWLSYGLAILTFSVAGFASLYAILRLQAYLPWNPQGFDGVAPDLAFNTAISFVTNTNWQAYAGEATMSHFSQMAGLAVHNFLSAATGIALAVAVTRAFARTGAATLGNFWVDLTRATLYVLLPLSIVVALAFVALGMPQTLAGSADATTLEGAKQVIALGPIASQEAIKQLGTNGGGFLNTNSAHPFENPNAVSNLLSIFSMLVVSAAMPIAVGRMVGARRQGYALLAAMALLLIAGVAIVYAAETSGNPLLTSLGLDPSTGNMEGKEVRFGQAMSALFVAVTTGLSCGAVNAMHASLTPLGGFVPLFLIQLGEVLPGGVGSGLYGMIVFAILAVFVAGLMVGRTPEFLGKKIEAREMKLAMLAVLILPLVILGFSAVAAMLPAALASLANAGPHGLTEILYAYSSGAGNNGSAFAGLNANTPWFNTTLGISMLLGRFAYVVPVLAIAGSLAAKKRVPASAGTFPTDTPLFVGLQPLVIPFAAQTRISGIDVDVRSIRKGAVDAILRFTATPIERASAEFRQAVDRVARTGGTPLAVAENGKLLGVIHLKDVIKPNIKERFAALRAMGIKTVMVTGDNPVTAAAIASEAGVDDFIAEATPEDKLAYIRREQTGGRLIAMCGDCTNDAPALAQADVGVAMQSGTQAAREAGNMVDLDSNPTKLIEIVEIGKQLLMTRGSLTTFSIANDVAKYFAILPALFVATYPQLGTLNVMRLASPQSAILSAVIFNALIIIALIPLTLRGVGYRRVGASALLRRNLLVYGLGGLVLPFIGIKAIDVIVAALHLA